MEEKGWGTWGIVIFLIILFAVFWGGFGNRGRGGYDNDGGCGVVSNCQVEKQGIIDSARTQYLIEQQAAATREVVSATANVTQTKIDFYEYQNLRDKVNERDLMISELKNQLFVKDQLAPVNAALASIKCNMLPKPEITGIGAVCPNAGILNGLGINSFNSCGCNGLV